MPEPSAPAAGTTAVRWDRRRWTLLTVLSGNMILDALEASIVLPVLPAVAARLHQPVWDAQWLMTGFALGFAVALLPGPVLAARLGRRRTYLGALALLALASVAGGLASTLPALIASRAVQGVAAALTAPAGLAVIADEFPPGAQQRRAVSVYALFGAAGFTAGLLLSAGLTALNWRLPLLFPALMAVVLLVAAWPVIPAARPAAPFQAAAPVPARRWAGLLRDELLLRSALGAACLNGGYLSLLLVIAVRLSGHGWTAAQVALGLLPASVPLVVTTPFAGRLVARFGPARLILAGAAAALTAETVFLARPAAGGYPDAVLPVLLLVEAGFVLSFAALNMQAASAIRPERRAAAVGVYQTGVQLGAVVLLPAVAVVSVHSGGGRAAAALITATGLIGLLAAGSGYRPGAARRYPTHQEGQA